MTPACSCRATRPIRANAMERRTYLHYSAMGQIIPGLRENRCQQDLEGYAAVGIERAGATHRADPGSRVGQTPGHAAEHGRYGSHVPSRTASIRATGTTAMNTAGTGDGITAGITTSIRATGPMAGITTSRTATMSAGTGGLERVPSTPPGIHNATVPAVSAGTQPVKSGRARERQLQCRMQWHQWRNNNGREWLEPLPEDGSDYLLSSGHWHIT